MKPGHHDPAGGLDHGGIDSPNRGLHGDDVAALEQHIGLGKVADLWIHAEHGSTPITVRRPGAPMAGGGAGRH